MNSDESKKEQQNAESNKIIEVNTMTETNQMIETNQMTGANLITEDTQITGVIPAPLTALYCERYNEMNVEELKKEAESLFYTMSISMGDAEAIQKATIMQHSCAQ